MNACDVVLAIEDANAWCVKLSLGKSIPDEE